MNPNLFPGQFLVLFGYECMYVLFAPRPLPLEAVLLGPLIYQVIVLVGIHLKLFSEISIESYPPTVQLISFLSPYTLFVLCFKHASNGNTLSFFIFLHALSSNIPRQVKPDPGQDGNGDIAV